MHNFMKRVVPLGRALFIEAELFLQRTIVDADKECLRLGSLMLDRRKDGR